MNTETEGSTETALPLTGSHLRTYHAIFQHPVSHNLARRDVDSMLRHLGQVNEEPNGKLKVTRNGQHLVMHSDRSKVSTTDEIMALRHFLKQSEPVIAPTDAQDADWLLVIDHHEARIFRSRVHGETPEGILPHQEEDYQPSRKSENFSKGKEKPDANSFFDPLALALHGARQILIFGTGTGTSNEMEQFVSWLKSHHPDLSERVVGALVVDEHHLTDGQLLARAREFYASISAGI
jgi:hypothetical protein